MLYCGVGLPLLWTTVYAWFPAQLRRPLQVAACQGLVPPRRQAAVVNPILLARPLQRPVCLLLPDLPGLCNPVLVHHRPALLGTAALRALPAWPLSPEQPGPEIVIGEVHHPVEPKEIFNPE